MRVATARHSAPVSGVARCAWPFDIMRTAMSMSAGASLRPDSTVMATGGATKATNGTLRLPAFSRSGAMPIATDAARRMASSLASSCGLPSISVGRSVAGGADRLGRHEHARIGGIDHAHGHAAHARHLQHVGGLAGGEQLAGLGAAGLHETRAGWARRCRPRRRASCRRPRRPHRRPCRSGETMIFFVLVLWMRTTASPSRGGGTSPSSTANGPMAEDMFPQLLL